MSEGVAVGGVLGEAETVRRLTVVVGREVVREGVFCRLRVSEGDTGAEAEYDRELAVWLREDDVGWDFVCVKCEPVAAVAVVDGLREATVGLGLCVNEMV